MTILSSINKQQHSGNGATTAFAFGYLFLEDSHLEVTITVVSTGVDTLQTLNSDYTVTGAGVSSGGTVTFSAAPASGERVTIRRVVPYTQDSDYTEAGDFPAETTESALDMLTMQAQQLNEASDRTVSLSATTTVTGGISIDDPSTGKGVVWDATGKLVNTTTDLSSVEADAAQVAADKIEVAADKAAAEISATSAAASAASVNLPNLSASGYGKILIQNDGDDGYEFLAQGGDGAVLQSAGSDAPPAFSLPAYKGSAIIPGVVSNGDYLVGMINSNTTVTEVSGIAPTGTATVTIYLSTDKTSASGTAITGGALSVSTSVDRNALTANNTTVQDTTRYVIAAVSSASSVEDICLEFSYTKKVDE